MFYSILNQNIKSIITVNKVTEIRIPILQKVAKNELYVDNRICNNFENVMDLEKNITE